MQAPAHDVGRAAVNKLSSETCTEGLGCRHAGARACCWTCRRGKNVVRDLYRRPWMQACRRPRMMLDVPPWENFVARSRFQSPVPACAFPSHSAIVELRLLERAACPRGYDSAHGIREAWKGKINISCHRSLLLRCRVVLRFDGARARRSLHQSGNTRSFNITIFIIFVDHHHLNIRTFIIFVVVVVLLSERRAFASTSFHLLDR